MSQENNFIPTLDSYKRITPFKLFVKSNFPFIEATYEALDNYGLYCKIVEYLNNVIANENTVENNVTALYNAFVQLNTYVSDYFDNLDVQEEINNKLDDMVEQGTLEEIISAYLDSQAIFGYNSVNEMINAENLINGSYAKTLGYYAINDGGSGLYKIRNRTFDDVVDNGSIIVMNNTNLVAELVADVVNVKQYGAYGDNDNDDSNAFINAINYANKYHKKIFIPSGNYKITLDLPTLYTGMEIVGVNESTQGEYNSIIRDYRTSENFLFEFDVLQNDVFVTGGGISNLCIFYEGESISKCIHLKNTAQGWDSYFNNLFITRYTNAIKSTANDTKFENCLITSCSKYVNSTVYFAIELYNNANENNFINCHFEHCRYVMHVTNTAFLNHFTGCKVEMSKANMSYSELTAPILIDSTNDGTPMSFTNCSLINVDLIAYSNESNASFSYNSVPALIRSTSSMLLISNCNFLCGLGSGSVTVSQAKQSKYILASYGNVTNCNFKTPSYFTPSVSVGVGNVSNNMFLSASGGTYNCTHNTIDAIINNDNTCSCKNNIFYGYYVRPYISGESDYVQTATGSKSHGDYIVPAQGQSLCTYVLEWNGSGELFTMLDFIITMKSTNQLRGECWVNAYITESSTSLTLANKILNFGTRTINVYIKNRNIYFQFQPSGRNQVLIELKGYNHQNYTAFYDPSITSAITEYDKTLTIQSE